MESAQYNQVSLLSSPTFSGTQTPSSVHFFLAQPTERPTITRDGAMGNETFYWDGLKKNKTNYFPLDLTLGTLSNDDDDDGSENDSKKKMNLRSFKLNRVYLDPLNMSNSNDFSWS